VDIALRYVECINRLDLDGLVELMPEDYVFIDLAGDEYRGLAHMKPGWLEYFTNWPEYMIHVSEVYLVEHTVVLIGRTTGSHLKKPRHVEIQDTLIWTAEIEDQKVKVWRLYYDTDENRKMLGVAEEARVTR
jgi:ketosteroid isomerase-like protein